MVKPKKKQGLLIGLAITFLVIAFPVAGTAQTGPPDAGKDLSAKDFLHPPLDARPGALWPWLNGYVKKDQITRELEEMKAKGMRGCIIWDIGSLADPQKMIPVGPAFMDTESIASIRHAIREASRLGLELGLAAASSWNAGGAWIAPSDGSKVLLYSETQAKGPGFFNDTLPVPQNTNKYHRELVVLAMPGLNDSLPADPKEILDISRFLDDSGRLQWTIPAGSWRILRFVSSNTGQLLECPSPHSNGLVLDHLSKVAVEHHLNFMLEKLRAGHQDLGSLKYFFLDSYELWEGIDWTGDFIKAFMTDHGYDPIPYLPALSGKLIGSREITGRFKQDYSKTVSNLIIANHFSVANDLLHKNGLQLIAEAGHGGSARVDVLKAMGAVDFPMGEFWNHQRFWVTKEAASAAHIYGKKYVPAETLTGWRNWQDGPMAYKRLIDVAFCAGLNQVTFHTFAHNPPEAGLPGFAYHAGEHFNVNNTWWNYSGPLLEYLSRCSYMLQQGQFVADVGLYYGDQAPNLVPSRRIDPAIKPIYDSASCLHCGRPKPVQTASLGPGYDYDYINEDVILHRMYVSDGRLVLPGGMSYRMLVLPDREEISPAVLRKLRDFIREGATVVGRKPLRSGSLQNYPDCDREVKAIGDSVWGSCDGVKIREHHYGKGLVVWNRPLRKVLAGMRLRPDFEVEKMDNRDQHIDYIHRRTETADYYFISNSAYHAERPSCFFRVDPGMVPKYWNAADGSVTDIFDYQPTADGIRIQLTMPPVSSVFVVFKKADAAPGPIRIYRVLTKKNLPNESPAMADIAIRWSDGRRLSAQVGRAGIYQLKNAAGKTALIRVDSIPAPLTLDGPWTLSFPKGRGAPDSLTLNKLISWTELPQAGARYFSGTAAYTKNFTLDPRALSTDQSLFLDLGQVKEVAEVFINGESAAVLWKEPFLADISRYVHPGRNELKITVTNLWNNRLAGDARPGNLVRYTKTNLTRAFSAKTPLITCGLLSPVRIIRTIQRESEFK